jgi:hypothetical protein
VLPVALDLTRILANQVVAKGAHDRVDGVRVGPAGGLAETDQPTIGADAGEVRTAEQQRFDLRDPPRACPPVQATDMPAGSALDWLGNTRVTSAVSSTGASRYRKQDAAR